MVKDLIIIFFISSIDIVSVLCNISLLKASAIQDINELFLSFCTPYLSKQVYLYLRLLLSGLMQSSESNCKNFFTLIGRWPTLYCSNGNLSDLIIYFISPCLTTLLAILQIRLPLSSLDFFSFFNLLKQHGKQNSLPYSSATVSFKNAGSLSLFSNLYIFPLSFV